MKAAWREVMRRTADVGSAVGSPITYPPLCKAFVTLARRIDGLIYVAMSRPWAVKAQMMTTHVAMMMIDQTG